MRTTLIVNPYASKVTTELAEQVARALGAAETVFTERAGHATELARDADADAVVVFSGDGGFNEALNGARPETVSGLRSRRRDERAAAGARAYRAILSRPQRSSRSDERAGSGSAARTGAGSPSPPGSGSTPSWCAGWTRAAGAPTGKRPGDAVFAWTAVKTLAETRVRFDPALEVEGHGRAAFALVANADPYTYLGRMPLRLPRGAQLEGGLDLLAPRSLRLRSLPGRCALHRHRPDAAAPRRAARRRPDRDPLRRADAAPARR